MPTLRQIRSRTVQRFPFLDRIERFAYRFKPYRSKFITYARNLEDLGSESLAGENSSLERTRFIREALPRIWKEFDVHTILDVPCNDFNWMKAVDLSGVDYLGCDIVPELIQRNTERYQNAHVSFRCLDVMKEPIPKSI